MGGRNTWIKNPKPLGSWSGHSSVPLTYIHTHPLPAWNTVIYSFNSPARWWKRIVLSENACMGSFDHSVGLDCYMGLLRHWCERRACNCQPSCFQLLSSWACSCSKSQKCSSAAMPVNCSLITLYCVCTCSNLCRCITFIVYVYTCKYLLYLHAPKVSSVFSSFKSNDLVVKAWR